MPMRGIMAFVVYDDSEGLLQEIKRQIRAGEIQTWSVIQR